MKNIAKTIGSAAIVAASAAVTTGLVPAWAAPQQSPGVTLGIKPDPTNSAQYLLTIQGELPMSEGAAHDRLNNLSGGGGMDYIVFADDPGDTDNPIGGPHGFIGTPGPPGGNLIATPAGLSFSRDIRLPRGDLNEDFCFSFGCGDDVDEVYVKVRFVQGNGASPLVAYSNAVSGRFGS